MTLEVLADVESVAQCAADIIASEAHLAGSPPALMETSSIGGVGKG